MLAKLGNLELARKVRPARPPFPFEIEYLWDWFNEFTWGLKANGMGPVMADWGDVLDWCEAVGVQTEPWERKALVRLAHARAVIGSEKSDGRSDKT